MYTASTPLGVIPQVRRKEIELNLFPNKLFKILCMKEKTFKGVGKVGHEERP